MFLKEEKDVEQLTPIMFDGHPSDMYIEKVNSNAGKLLIALMDYLGEDFTDLLIERYGVKCKDELLKAINDRKERNKSKI